MSTARALKRIQTRCEDIKTAVAKFNEDTLLEEVETNIKLLEDEWQEYRELEKLIDESNKYETLQNLLEALFFKLKQVLVRAKKEREAEVSKHSHNASMDELMANQQSFLQEVSILNKRDSEVRLPRINIPTFSGKYSEFPSFKDLFEASIDSNAKISKVHKFQYLKGLLTGEAAALVRYIAVTEANYIEAWDKIKERYDKKRLVISTLIKQFVDQPAITKLSAKALHQMSDLSDEVLRGLKVLGAEAEKRDPWLIHILVNKLDGATKQAWATETAEEDFPSLERFFKFLNRRSDSLDTVDSNKLAQPANNRVKSLHSASTEPVCIKCSKDHYLSKCDQFLSLSVHERRGFVSEKKLCFNCLSPTHQAVVCRSKYRCGKCHRKHHLTLHPEDVQPTEVNEVLNGNVLNLSEASASNNVQNNNAILPSFHSLLPTAMVQVADPFGNLLKCRVLLDSGSQASFITEACMQRLKLPRSKANILISGLTSGKIATRGAVSISVQSLHYPEDEIMIDALIISQLSAKLPSFGFKVQDCSFLNELKLADPEYNKVGPVDILIGADRFFHIIKDGRVTNFNSSLIAQITIFGWVVSGITDGSTVERSEAVHTNICTLNLHLDVDIDSTLKRFFEQEEIPSPQMLSQEEAECEEHYKLTHKRTEEGRYMVEIPFKRTAGLLGNSMNAAKRRFLALERKLQANPSIKEEYQKFVREYLDLGYLKPIKADEIIEDSKCFYLPHHCVFKVSSETTKLRVVFDGSAKTSTGVSLNETMMVGPTIQPTLWSSLMRFRYYKVALIGDIDKMYNQVAVAEPGTNFQRMLWRSEPTNELKHYKLSRVTFGLASSSFLAIRTLQQVGYDNQQDHPDIVPHILEDFYVDDFISGTDTVEEVRYLQKEISHILKTGGFHIRKWKSNVSEIRAIEDIDQISRFQNPTEAKILGLQWNAAEDSFSFRLALDDDTKITKRRIISEYSRVFDPLGWLSPSIILMKIVFQNLWLMKLGWDDEVPGEISKIYKKIRDELKLLENLKIKRVIPQNGQIEIHGFSDASEKAYSAVVYCRVIDENGVVSVNLMASKTKVAPIKQISLPRLELCGSYLVTKLLMLVKETIKRPVKCYAWTDSTIVLMWLSSHPARWKTFVANRTSEVLNEIPRNCWNHIRSEHNPADCASRGVLPSKLVNLAQWWHGPEWLQKPDISYTSKNEDVNEVDYLLEERMAKLFGFNTHQQEGVINYLMQRTSAYSKMIRVLAYVLRFLKNARLPKSERNLSFVAVEELQNARNAIIKYVQQDSFASEISCLRRKLEIGQSSDIIPLAPFIDASGILRVGSRLRHSSYPYDYKHPIILPKGHVFSRVVVEYMHKQNLHPGPSLTFHLTRQQFWIVGGRSIIRNIVRNCVVCFKSNARASKQLMGDLPIVRLKAARPFTSCGVDYAGPIQLVTKRGRGAKFIKGYIAIFVCMVTKAVHIEAVSDLSTNAFIAVLKRFVSRRGAPAHIYSDNGSNFIGAKRQMNEVYEIISSNNHNCLVAEHLSKSEIQWHFNPPASPHFGGLWEAAVKSVKTHVVRYTSNTHLVFEEMTTLLSQIEAILNSRPLYVALDGDASFEVLTPSHFLIGSSNFYLPEEPINEGTPAGRLTRWQFVQQRVQSFWRKFSTEYVHNLQQRVKWRKVQENFNIDDVVLIKEDNLPSYKWALGKILQLHPDDRGIVRVVTLKTSKSTFKRPIVKLCKLLHKMMVNDVIVNGPENVGVFISEYIYIAKTKFRENQPSITESIAYPIKFTIITLATLEFSKSWAEIKLI